MKQALTLGGRCLATYIAVMLLSPMLLGSIGGDWYWAQVALNILLLGAFLYLTYIDGSARGEHAATVSATIRRIQGEGRPAGMELDAKRHMPKVALIAYLVVAVPFALVATANLIAEPYYPPVLLDEAALDSSDAEYQAELSAALQEGETDQTEVPVPLQTPENKAETDSVNPFSVAARLVFIPLLSMFRAFAQNPHGLNLLFLLWAFVMPLGEAVGYLSGPRFRQKKLDAITKGKKKKLRNLKVNQPKPPRAPKTEV